MHVCVRVCGQVSVCVISQLVMACDSAAVNVLAGERLRAQRHKCAALQLCSCTILELGTLII